MPYRGYSGNNRSNRFQAASESSGSERLVVYTDGSCINNGRPDARAGVGVYIPENS